MRQIMPAIELSKGETVLALVKLGIGAEDARQLCAASKAIVKAERVMQRYPSFRLYALTYVYPLVLAVDLRGRRVILK